MNDSFFEKIEKKTNVDKDTLLALAHKLQTGNYKDENTLKEIIHELSSITGRSVSEEKENKISLISDINTALQVFEEGNALFVCETWYCRMQGGPAHAVTRRYERFSLKGFRGVFGQHRGGDQEGERRAT